MEAKRAMNMRSVGVLAILCLAICAMLGFVKPAQAAELKPGTYEVGATLMKADNPTQESMAKGALVSPIKVTADKEGNYSATVTMQGLTVTMFGRTMTSYTSGVNYWDGNKYAPATVLSYQPYNGAQYPKDITFPLVNKMKGDDSTGFVKIQTVTPGPSGAQAVYLKINWNELSKNLVNDNPATKTTVSGVTYAVSGKNATVTSIPKKAKSATVKSTVKIGSKTYKVTSVSKNAAAKSKKLAKITLGKNVKTIGSKAFYNSKKLKTVTFQGKSVKTIGSKAFKGISKKATFKAPKSKVKSYKKLVKKAGAPKTAKYKAA